MIRVVLIDMDNTLLETQALYTAAEQELVRRIGARTGAEEGLVAADLQRRKVTLFERYGYDPAMLPQAFEETLIRFLPAATADDILSARTLAQGIFEQEARLKDGVAEAVATLAEHFALCLVTAGHDEVQRRRIETLPFRDLFRETFVVPDKTPEVYLSVLRRFEYAPEEAVMIGDSLKSDIIPAVAAGLSAIHIPGDNWEHEMQGLDLPPERAVRHLSLRDAVDFLVGQPAPVAEKKPLPRRAPGPRF